MGFLVPSICFVNSSGSWKFYSNSPTWKREFGQRQLLYSLLLGERSTAVCLLHPKVMYHQRTIVFLHKKRAKIIRSGERTCFTVYRHVRAFHTRDTSKSFAGLLYPFNLLISFHVSCYCLPQLAISSASFQAPITAQGAAEAVFSHAGMLSVRGKAWTSSSWKGYGDGPREAKAKCTVLCNNSQLCCYN